MAPGQPRREEPIVFRGHTSEPYYAAFSPDGTRVGTASWDGTARVSRVTWPSLLAYLEENIHACLTPEQRVKFLGESSSEAWDTYEDCEHRHGREPDVRDQMSMKGRTP